MSDETGMPHINCGTFTLTEREKREIYESAMKQKAEREARLPTEESCIAAMCDGFTRLRDFGWKEATYAPKHESLDLIEVGSTGIHHGYRDEIGFWIQDDDTWPSKPVLFRKSSPPPEISQ